MSGSSTDSGVFIRSMATRGAMGGLACSTMDVVKVLDAAGFDYIFIETVGVGQDEVDIIELADTTILVLTPGFGDTVQNIKAGVMEIADIYVVNKDDLEGADLMYGEVMQRASEDSMIMQRPWTPPVCRTVAVQGQGTADVLQEILNHQDFLSTSGALIEKRKEKTRREIIRLINQELYGYVTRKFFLDGQLNDIVESIHAGEKNLYQVVDRIIGEWLQAGLE